MDNTLDIIGENKDFVSIKTSLWSSLFRLEEVFEETGCVDAESLNVIIKSLDNVYDKKFKGTTWLVKVNTTSKQRYLEYGYSDLIGLLASNISELTLLDFPGLYLQYCITLAEAIRDKILENELTEEQ